MPSERRHQFPTHIRLKRRADFQRVYAHGVRVAGRHVVMFLMRAVTDHGKFGVTASRRVGGAVVRSRCKRRLRELYRTHRNEFEWRTVDTVVNARGSAATVPWPELEGDFLACARRAFDKVALNQRQK